MAVLVSFAAAMFWTGWLLVKSLVEESQTYR